MKYDQIHISDTFASDYYIVNKGSSEPRWSVWQFWDDFRRSTKHISTTFSGTNTCLVPPREPTEKHSLPAVSANFYVTFTGCHFFWWNGPQETCWNLKNSFRICLTQHVNTTFREDNGRFPSCLRQGPKMVLGLLRFVSAGWSSAWCLQLQLHFEFLGVAMGQASTPNEWDKHIKMKWKILDMFLLDFLVWIHIGI